MFSTLPSQKESPKDYIDKKLPPLVVKEHHLNHQDSSRRVDEEIRLANSISGSIGSTMTVSFSEAERYGNTYKIGCQKDNFS